MSSTARYRVHRKAADTGKKRPMAPQRMLGIFLVLAGAGVVAFGLSQSHAGEVTATGTATAVHAATWYVMAGIGVVLAGFILSVLGIRRASVRR